MNGSLTHDLTQDLTHGLALLWPHLHDISVSALAAAVATLGVVIMLELRSVLKLRQVVDGNLARVFEQLDLLRFENQQLIEGQQLLIEARTQSGTALPALRAAPAQPASAQPGPPTAAPSATTTTTTVHSGEVRLLSSLAQARARRALSEPVRA